MKIQVKNVKEAVKLVKSCKSIYVWCPTSGDDGTYFKINKQQLINHLVEEEEYIDKILLRKDEDNNLWVS